MACTSGEICFEGQCRWEGCAPIVIFLIDRSGSMSGDWQDVATSMLGVVAAHPQLRFGLMAFPIDDDCDVSSSLQVPLTMGDLEPFVSWFGSHDGDGSTPLLGAMDAVLAGAPSIFGSIGGTLVVVSDGEDTCADESDEEIVPLLGGDAGLLQTEHDVHTYVIGYSYSGDAAPLDIMASYGGTDYKEFIPAGSESELTQALSEIVTDIKLCD